MPKDEKVNKLMEEINQERKRQCLVRHLNYLILFYSNAILA